MTLRLIRAALIASSIALAPGLAACSVGMAASGDEPKNLSLLRPGVPRADIEREFGKPISSSPSQDGRSIDTYKIELGNEPSAGRAVGHAALDVLTFGLWEVVGTPIEMVQGRSYHAVVTYTADGTVDTVETNRSGASSW